MSPELRDALLQVGNLLAASRAAYKAYSDADKRYQAKLASIEAIFRREVSQYTVFELPDGTLLSVSVWKEADKPDRVTINLRDEKVVKV